MLYVFYLFKNDIYIYMSRFYEEILYVIQKSNFKSLHYIKIVCCIILGKKIKHDIILYISADGEWSPWSDWSDCTATCAGGIQDRSRTCSNPPPQSGGNNCTGPGQDSQRCNAQHCPGYQIQPNTFCSNMIYGIRGSNSFWCDNMEVAYINE